MSKANDPKIHSSRPKGSAAGLVVVGISVTLWWPAFTLGVWGTLFFDQLIGVWAAATACLVVVLVQPRPYKGRVWQAIALCVPSLWLVLSFTADGNSDNTAVLLADLAGILVAMLGLPLTAWVLVRLLWPGFGGDLPSRRRWILLAAVLGITGISYLLGVFQADFLTCGDFSISGNSLPPGCRPDEKMPS